MTSEQIMEVLKTRLEMARQEGNPTEESFLYELLKMSKEFKKMKEDDKHA